MPWIYILIAIVFIAIVVCVISLVRSYTQKDQPYIQETKDYIQNFKLENIKLDNVDVEKANKLIEKVNLKIKDKEAVKVTTLGLEVLEGKLWSVNTIKNFSGISIKSEGDHWGYLYNSPYSLGIESSSSSSFTHGAITENKPDTELDFNLLKDILGEQPKQLLFKKDWALVDISYINEEANQKLEEKKKQLLSNFSDMTNEKATKFKEELNCYASKCITKHEICYYHKPTHLLLKINYEI